MTTFEVGGQTYQARPLSAFAALDVASRIGVVLSGMADIKKVNPPADERLVRQALCAQLSLVPAAEVERVTQVCLATVTRQQAVGWAPILAPTAGRLMFNDIDLGSTLGILWAVLEANGLPDFFSTPPSASGEGGGGT